METLISSFVLDTISVPIVLLEPECRVLYINAAARKVLDGRFGMSVASGRLILADGNLQTVIQSAIDGIIDSGHAHKMAIALPADGDGRKAVLHLALAKTDGDGTDRTRKPTLIAIIGWTRDLEPHELERLRETFDFSEAEADVAGLIVSGSSPSDIAKSRKTSVKTIRWHIKNIHSKTHTRRLPDLILQILAVRSPF